MFASFCLIHKTGMVSSVKKITITTSVSSCLKRKNKKNLSGERSPNSSDSTAFLANKFSEERKERSKKKKGGTVTFSAMFENFPIAQDFEQRVFQPFWQERARNFPVALFSRLLRWWEGREPGYSSAALLSAAVAHAQIYFKAHVQSSRLSLAVELSAVAPSRY